jgi:DNA-binding NarL/FixJ family response regulator
MAKKKILIADDHSAIRSGVRNILSEDFPDIEFGEAKDAAEAIQKLQASVWDVLILDIDLPGRGGLDVLKYIKEEQIKTPVLVFSFHREEQIAMRALRSGASGYLSKDVADVELKTAIRQLLQGQKYVSRFVSEQLVHHLQKPKEGPPHELLSGREYQTLLLIAKGRTVSQIAEELHLSVSTVNTYRARILEKMGAGTNAELTSYVFRQNLL